MKKWNPEMVNSILRNENYTGTLFQGKKRKLNYRVNKKINIDKENWIVAENHHEAIINKEKFDKVQDILDRQTKVNKDGITSLGATGIVEIDNQLKIIFGKNAKELKKCIDDLL